MGKFFSNLYPFKFPLFLLITAFVCLLQCDFCHSAGSYYPDGSIYKELLRKYVKNEEVDYQGFKRDEKLLDIYLDMMCQVEIEKLNFQEKKAYYINLYNAWTVKLILTRYPDIKSIKDIGNIFFTPWKQKIVKLKDKTISLDNIEHDILRKDFKDPRIHFAVNCASKSCPPLHLEPYYPDILDEQLDNVAAAYINNPIKTYIKGNKLYVVMIFKWYGDDFNNDIKAFVRKYATGEFKDKIEKNYNDLEVVFLEYDWSLNGK